MSYFILQFLYLTLIPLKLSYSLYFMIFLHTGFFNVFFFLNLQYYFCLILLLGTLIPYYYCYLITTIHISTLTLFSFYFSDILATCLLKIFQNSFTLCEKLNIFVYYPPVQLMFSSLNPLSNV